MEKFWRDKNLSDLTREEWESLCDGCARCCLHKLQDEDTDEVFFTNVACHYLDAHQCRCKDYQHRQQRVPECLVLDRASAEVFSWLPSTCAYRLVAEGKDLKWWHPLVSGNRDSVYQAGISVKGKTIAEKYVHEDAMQDHIVTWVN